LRNLLRRSGFGVVAALHELDERFSKGDPIRMRLLAQKGAEVAEEPDPAGALKAVIAAYVELREARKAAS
jgi:hypothetical protein